MMAKYPKIMNKHCPGTKKRNQHCSSYHQTNLYPIPRMLIICTLGSATSRLRNLVIYTSKLRALKKLSSPQMVFSSDLRESTSCCCWHSIFRISLSREVSCQHSIPWCIVFLY